MVKRISLFEVFGNNIITRNSIFDFFTELEDSKDNKIVLDFKGITFISRSCADEYLKNKKNKLYNYISNLILNECSLDNSHVNLIVDKSKTNRSLREDFDNYIRKSLNQKNQPCKLIIKHENSQKEGCLQVLDFISWAIFRNYEYKDSRFMDIIKDKIVIKKEVFEKLSGP